jgi:hypothetical protein
MTRSAFTTRFDSTEVMLRQVVCLQGDEMRFWKIAQPLFCQNWCIIITVGNVAYSFGLLLCLPYLRNENCANYLWSNQYKIMKLSKIRIMALNLPRSISVQATAQDFLFRALLSLYDAPADLSALFRLSVSRNRFDESPFRPKSFRTYFCPPGPSFGQLPKQQI